MRGSQPWNIAIKWYNCNHMMMRGKALKGKSIFNFFCLLNNYQGMVVFFSFVCSICWIKFQPLWFAIKNIYTSLMDKVLDILIEDWWDSSHFLGKLNHRTVPSVDGWTYTIPKVLYTIPRHGKAPLGVLIIKHLYPKVERCQRSWVIFVPFECWRPCT